MNSHEIEQNVKRIIENFSKENFLYDLLLAYEFKPYEAMFQKVHQEIKEGKRQIRPFHNIEKNLHVDNFYLIDGVMLYFKEAKLEKSVRELKSGDRERI